MNPSAARSRSFRHRRDFSARAAMVTTCWALAAASISRAQSYEFSAMAPTASFRGIQGIALDPVGNVIVADSSNHTVHRISSDGAAVTLLAGSAGIPGSENGVGPSARFSSPTGVAVDPAGNIFITDLVSNTVRRISPAGVVSTFAGEPGFFGQGFADGTGGAARFSNPSGIAIDRAGNLYVADTRNYTIRKITPNAVVSTFAGRALFPGRIDGVGAAARFDSPVSLAVDARGNVYVLEFGNNVSAIRRISPAAEVTTIVAPAFGQVGPGIAVDPSGNLLISDSELALITPEGERSSLVTTIAGGGGQGLAIDAGGTVFFADSTRVWRGVRRASAPVTPTDLPLRVRRPPMALTVAPGASAVFTVDATGTNLTYQWQKDGKAVPNATDAALIIPNVAAGDVGSYSVTVGNHQGFVPTVPVALALGAGSSRLTNLSVRGRVEAGGSTLIAGFNVLGAGTQPLLLRAVGPTLAILAVTDPLQDPALRVLSQDGTSVAENDDWGAAGAAFVSTAAAAGAFALPSGSKDAGLLLASSSGAYTAQVTGSSGVALLEIYDTGAPTGPRLSNLSARMRAGAGSNTAIVGFNIIGPTAKTVLIRGIGPALDAFGVSGALTDPHLQVFRGGSMLIENDDWGGGSPLRSAFAQAGAFAPATVGKDAAVLITLPPGGYTVHITTTATAADGVALVEIYELP